MDQRFFLTEPIAVSDNLITMTIKRMGETLRALRERRGITQTELAERAGLAQSYVAELETGKKQNPSLEALTRLAKVLGVGLADLLAPKGRGRK